MKTVKNLFSILMIAFSLVLASCGGESEDPKPQKTDLELIKEGIVGTSWSFVSAVVVANGKTYNYAGNCDFTSFNDLAGNKSETIENIRDMEYDFTASALTYDLNCITLVQSTSYSIVEEGGSFHLKYTIGSYSYDYQITSTVDEVEAGTVKVKLISPLRGAATSVITTLSRI